MSYYVAFRLEGRGFALPLDHVARVLRMVAVTPVPDAPDWVLGAVDMAGRVMPVLDLRQRFGGQRRPPHLDDRLLVVNAGPAHAAILVDTVTGVMDVPADRVEPASGWFEGAGLDGVIREGGELFLVLAVNGLIQTAQRAEAHDR